ncbi:MAG: hypothetical protein JSS02_26410 [Planctomycetes bacterium]|nr:hypothetical protein [Planctomycetota bacterium]
MFAIIRVVFRLWLCKWSLLRLLIAAGLLIILATDNSARLARVHFNSMPAMDYLDDVRNLRADHRYAEALMVAEAGLDELHGSDRDHLQAEMQQIREEQESVVRRGKELLRGALVGEGDSLEALVGAVGADMFVVGDVRDLVIQGGRLAVDGDSDELILALSAVGLLTTVMPEIDWVAAFLKVAKKGGALSKRMVEGLVRLVRRATDTQDYTNLRRVFGGFQTLLEKSTPAGALRVMRYLDDTKDVELIANFLKRQKTGGFVLHVAGKDGIEILKKSSRASEDLLVQATKKGDAGMAWLRSGGQRLLRPHLVVGALKGLQKGTIQQAVTRIAAEYDPYGWLVIPACAVWTFLEAVGLWKRLTAVTVAVAATEPPVARAA